MVKDELGMSPAQLSKRAAATRLIEAALGALPEDAVVRRIDSQWMIVSIDGWEFTVSFVGRLRG